MKNIYTALAAILLGIGALSAQDIFMVDSSYVHFFSEATLENIEAENNKAKGLINRANSKVAFLIPIKSFEFDKALMEEHFNENYMESEKFKTATFKGQINEKINWKKEGTYNVTVTGIINVHGVEKSRTIKGKLMVKESRIRVQTKFELKLVDHDIEIPTVVFQKIAEVIDVTVDLQFSLKK